MDLSAVLTAVANHATAAGAAVTPPIRDVRIGGLVPTSQRCIRVAYGGEAPQSRLGATESLGSAIVAERVVVTAWIAAPAGGDANWQAIELELRALKHELRTRLLGDATLGGLITDLEIAAVETEWVTIGESAVYRRLELAVDCDYEEYAIAP